MFPKIHVLSGFLVGLVILIFLPKLGIIGPIILFFASFLIDFDHYLYYVFLKKDMSLKNTFIWFVEKRKEYLYLTKEEKKKYYFCFCCFHGVESIILFCVFGIFLHNYFYFVAGGIFLHLILDLVEAAFIDKYPFTKWSVIYTFFKIKKLKKL